MVVGAGDAGGAEAGSSTSGTLGVRDARRSGAPSELFDLGWLGGRGDGAPSERGELRGWGGREVGAPSERGVVRGLEGAGDLALSSVRGDFERCFRGVRGFSERGFSRGGDAGSAGASDFASSGGCEGPGTDVLRVVETAARRGVHR